MLSSSKRQSWKEALKRCFDEQLKYIMSDSEYDQMLEDFLNGSDYALVNAISSQMSSDHWYSFIGSFSAATSQEVTEAYHSNDSRKVNQVAEKEARYQIEKQKQAKQKTEQAYLDIQLAAEEPPEARDLEDECVWIPASANHHY